ncbi:phosphonate metabolism transcriptional regulator PhnF [Muricoccus radiodurans]|uniref:phosphonate metabolism transcriptional regulator PhnF n=1 Tax=Muricoccus radiodurans TaxID=2231721 RepID=UPI003CF79D4A
MAATPPPGLRRGAGESLWRQITERLEAEIAAGRRAPGDRLPTEAALSAGFGVNRHTVRRALEDLELRGLVRTEQGRGSFVAEDVLDYPLRGRTRFSENVRAARREPAGRILRLSEVPADASVAEALGLRRNRPVLRVERLGLADGRPVVLGLHHLPLPRLAAAAAALRAEPSMTAAMTACGVPDYRRARTRITARLPTPEEAERLQQARIRPVLVSESLNVDPEGDPVDYTIGLYAAGRVQLLVEGEGD